MNANELSQVSGRELLAVLPLIVLAVTGIVVLLWDAFEQRPSRMPLTLTLIGSLAAATISLLHMNDSARAFGGMILDTSYSNFFSLVFSVGVFIAVLLAERYLKEEEVVIGEFAGLVLFSACGMVMLASAVDLIITFLGLETMSIAFYVLAGLFRKKDGPNEASLKYFLLGSFSAGFFLYGIALLYGSFHTTNLERIRDILSNSESAKAVMGMPIVWLGIGLLLVGFAFKIAAFPFHQWAPDVYDGAPTVVSGFMSTAGKAGAFSAMLLVFDMAFSPLLAMPASADKLRLLLCLLSVGSMLYGNITALSQTNVKRMLAYSSIAHAGYMLLGVATLGSEGSKAVAIYLAVYTLMQMGAFGVVALLEKESGTGIDLHGYAGLAKRRPWLAFIMAIMMLSLGGIPPFAGFFGKYYLFTAAIRSGLTPFAIIGIIASLISIYFYLRLIVLMYFREQGDIAYGLEAAGRGGLSVESTVTGAAVRVSGTGAAWTALVVSAIGLVVLGVLPMLLTNLVQQFFTP